jgi:long-chain acyl-CoA synthetase
VVAEISTIERAPEAATTAAARPWLRWYGNIPAELAYPEVTLYEAVARAAERAPDAVALDFFDTTATYREFLASIDTAARRAADATLPCM